MVENETEQVQENEPEILQSPYRVRAFDLRFDGPAAMQRWMNEQAEGGFLLHSITQSSVAVPRLSNSIDIRTNCVVVVERPKPTSP